MTAASQVTVTTSTVSETTVSSARFAVTFATCTAGGSTRWSISARIKSRGVAAGRRLEQAIQRVDPAASWTRRSSQDWSATGSGWTERHAALIDLAEALARFGAEGSGDA